MAENEQRTVVGRLRKASVSLADTVMSFNPQPGMWAATGTAIAYAPTITELREPVGGGENIEFNANGHSSRTVTTGNDGEPVLTSVLSRTALTTGKANEPQVLKRPTLERRQTLLEQAASDEKHNWKETITNGFRAVLKFVSSPTGFLMAVYGLNIVAWGAMLFFLLLGAAPAMNHPSKDSDASPRKKWIEIDSQILNALFCVTGFGLAPWRFRDLWWLINARIRHNRYAMKRLCAQNKAWFRPPAWYDPDSEDTENGDGEEGKRVTFTGQVAPPTRLWKLSFVVWMMILNTFFQGALAGFMWGYNRINRPSWATGTFIGLGCGVSLLAGLVMWWEGRKVKRIEGPVVKVVDVVEGVVLDEEKKGGRY
jgi:hypothetical protein